MVVLEGGAASYERGTPVALPESIWSHQNEETAS